MYPPLALACRAAQVMAAIQDVTQNGMSAMSKYQDDPEILAIIEELRSVF